MNFTQINAGTIGTKLGFAEEPACAKYCPNLTFKQRIIGFACCSGLGWMLSLMGVIVLFGGTSSNNVNTFIALYVVGNVVALCGTGFLLGPRSQCRQMFHPTRRWTTCFYLSMLIIVFSVAVTKQNVGLVLFLLFIEILAALWYTISFIPFARKMFIAFLRRSPCGPLIQAVDDAKEAMGFKKPPTPSTTINNTLAGVTGNNAKKKGFSFLGGEDN
eukprot:gene8928-9849_t